MYSGLVLLRQTKSCEQVVAAKLRVDTDLRL